MRRKFLATALAFSAFSAVAGAAVFSLAAPASGQTGYPPGLCTPTTGTQDVGTVTVGQQFVLQLAPSCVFTAGATVTVNANGVTFSAVAEPNGTVRLNVDVLSATQLSINGNIVPARCGVNTVTATGPSSAAQGQVSQTANFTLTCPTTGGPGTTGGTLSRTGADTVRYAAVAMALVVAGSIVVLVTRRRRADGTA